MRIGIIGASGFIGGALAREARARGHRVIAFSRRPDASGGNSDERRVVNATGPALDPTGLDALVNLAGESILGPWTRARRERMRTSRVALTERIVEALRRSSDGPAAFLNASASGFYGNRGDELLGETAPAGHGFLAELCVDWEKAALAAREAGRRVVLLRTGMVLGPGGGAWPLLRRVFGFGLGGRLGNGRQWVPWIHLEDEVGLILHAIENAAVAGPINLAAPESVTNAALTRALASRLHRPAFCHAPALALRLGLGDLSGVLLDSQRLEPRAALGSGYVFRHPGVDAALAALHPF